MNELRFPNSPAVAALACLGYLNALGLMNICDPTDERPLAISPGHFSPGARRIRKGKE